MAWLMFQIICLMHHGIKNKEARNSGFILTSMIVNIQVNKQTKIIVDSQGKDENNPPFKTNYEHPLLPRHNSTKIHTGIKLI